MTDDRKNIVLNTDSQYVVHCCTMLTSLLENNKNCKFNIHVISEGLKKSVINDIKNLVEDKYNQKLYLYIIDSEKLNYFPKYTNSHISQAANYRLFVDKILPSDIDKVYFVMNIYDAVSRKQNLGSLNGAWASVYVNGSQTAKFNIPDFNKNDTGIVLGALERIDGSWNFRTIGASQLISSLRDLRF